MQLFPEILKKYEKYNLKQGLQIYFDMDSGGSSSKREQASK